MLRTSAVAVLVYAGLTGATVAREVVDAGGRKVEVPDHINRIMVAGPPASVLLYMLAPEKMIGWNVKPREGDRSYLLPAVRDLPVVGRLTGRGNTASLEAVMAAKPDLILDFGTVSSTYVSLADRTQSQTGIPYLLVDGRFEHTADALRMLGPIIGASARAEQLAAYTDRVLAQTDKIVSSISEKDRPRVYLARRPNGLETGRRGSINTEIIERAGGRNVVDTGIAGNIATVSLEQVLQWNPDTIITLDRAFATGVKQAAPWASVEAVRRGRVFLSPDAPYGWVDSPPSLNRILGLQWLGHLFFPDRYPGDIRTETKEFYKLFYQIDLTASQLDTLLEKAQ